MTRVTFYLLDQDGPEADYFACRLAYKAWRGGLPVHIHTSDEKHCQSMDRLLWEWKEDCFLPHARAGSDFPPETPVTIGFQAPDSQEHRLLINLDSEVPDFFSDFIRVCEIVIDHPDQKQVSRNKFRTFRQQGITPETHTIESRR